MTKQEAEWAVAFLSRVPVASVEMPAFNAVIQRLRIIQAAPEETAAKLSKAKPAK